MSSADLSRRDVVIGAAGLGIVGLVDTAAAQSAAPAAREQQVRLAMAPYVGTATSRIDGLAKVTGAAKYAGEFNVPGMAHGSVVASTVARGRIVRIDAAEALKVDGVIEVLTHMNRPRMAGSDAAYKDDAAPDGSPFRPLYDDRVVFNGQPVALVLAESSEIARFAASLVRVDYQAEAHVTDLRAQRGQAFVVAKPEKPRGDAAKALAAAAVRVDAEYVIPMEHHNPMEPFAATAVWEGDGRLTVWDKTQGVQNVHRYLCAVFELKPDQIKVMSPFVGGGFGVGLRPQYEAVLAVLGAQALERSVRLVLSRGQMYGLGYRPATIERLALGATAGGALDVVTHEAIAITSQYEEFSRNDTGWSGLLYKSPNATTTHRLVRLDFPSSCDMRAPGAATGVYALECAMDELAVALKVDPLALRLSCYSERDQHDDVPYTSKKLRECYAQGAAAFGWDRRRAAPRSMRDGSELVGWGMATGIWEALQVPATARIVLTANGHAEVASAASDIGTGTYTIMAQVAADMLGLPLDNITVKLGDSSLPQAPVEGGSWLAASISQAIVVTAEQVRRELWTLAKAVPASPLANTRLEDVALVDGKVAARADASRGVSIADAMRHGGVDRMAQEGTAEFKNDTSHARNVHSAVFVEVKVDEQLGVVRVTRAVSAVAAGRILNPKTAHNQVMGSVVWGIGMALHEETLVDHRFGRIMNANFGEYHVPAHADVYDIKVIFVDEPDDIINPLGVKGLGEIGLVGVAAAVANAIYHATGRRVRDLPITLDKLLG